MQSNQKIAVVAALEREVWPFIKDWPTTRKQHEGRSFQFFEKDNVVVLCGGIGPEAARRAAETVIALYRPALVISAGFAGALDASFPVGHTLTPRHVIDAGDGSQADLGSGEGVLVSFATVADVGQKTRLAAAFGAHAVDMEAAAVARAADARGVRFLAIKVISDTSGAGLPPLTRFIGGDGRFQGGKFIRHVAVRPWLWRAVMKLARDSAVAARSLAGSLQQHQHAVLVEQTDRAAAGTNSR
jgi:adenosylhomocysteine nucleosidase